ncbi:putative glycosyltransferase [Apostasia shenzhenica]|uniref:Putative glycosyltransferase n=1 Tax=Apostasia shenzhenica TaxID=1088818 RepID=A0A2I0B7Y9_9ASPA|nr:putative glycosyltransferase [Apostasia shenzhenica]
MGYEINSPSIVEAIYYWCVPVIIAEIFFLPFDEVLYWSAFSIVIMEKDISKTLHALEIYTKKEMGNLHRWAAPSSLQSWAVALSVEGGRERGAGGRLASLERKAIETRGDQKRRRGLYMAPTGHLLLRSPVVVVVAVAVIAVVFSLQILPATATSTPNFMTPWTSVHSRLTDPYEGRLLVGICWQAVKLYEASGGHKNLGQFRIREVVWRVDFLIWEIEQYQFLLSIMDFLAVGGPKIKKVRLTVQVATNTALELLEWLMY